MKTFSPVALPCAAVCLLMITACSKSSHNTSAPSPTITSISPTHGPDSTQVTITGTNFSQTQTDNAVYFNGKYAYLLSATQNTLVAIVPTLAGTGNVTVKVNGVSATANFTANTFVYDTTWRLALVVNGLHEPGYLAMDPSGNLYVTTLADSLILEMNPQELPQIFATFPGDLGVASDTAGNIYAASTYNGMIVKFSPSGVIDTIAIDTGYLNELAVDNSGNVYAANNSKGTIDKITPQGVKTIVASNLFSCSGVAVAADGTVYTTNFSTPSYTFANGVVTKIAPGGAVSTLASFIFSGENGIYLGADGNLYVSNFDPGTYMGSVIKVSPAGTVTTLNSANIDGPIGITMDKAGNIYVVQLFDTQGGNIGSLLKMTMH